MAKRKNQRVNPLQKKFNEIAANLEKAVAEQRKAQEEFLVKYPEYRSKP